MSSADIDILITRFARQIRYVRALEAAGRAGIFAGLLAIAALLLAWRMDISSLQRLLGLVILLGGAMVIAWLIRMCFPLQKAAAAALIDRRYDLRQQLITAEELSRKNTSGELDGVVFARAAAAAGAIQRPNVYRRTRRTPAALGLILLTGLAAAMLPIHENPVVSAATERLADLSQVRREAMAESLRKTAQTLSAEEKQKLEALAKSIAENDPETFKKLLQEGQKDPKKLTEIMPLDIQVDLGLASAPKPPGDATAESPASKEDHPKAKPGMVSVYNPNYAPTENAEAPSPKVRPYLRYDDAWQTARAKAQASLATPTLPREYRAIIRRFYDLETIPKK